MTIAAGLEISGLTKSFERGGDPAVARVDLTVEAGELLVLLGPSGCGKTTLLRSIAGLERPDAGVVRISGETVVDADRGLHVPTHKRDIGMVFQGFALWPHLSVMRNVEYPLRARKWSKDARRQRAREVLAAVRCAEFSERLPGELSGGQQQRVAVARALAAQPALMLMDEPLSNLDAQLRHDLVLEIRRVHDETGFTGVYVTHDQMEAIKLADRIAVMRAGRIEQLAPAQTVYRAPATEYVAQFLGIKNRLALESPAQGLVYAGGCVVRGLEDPIQPTSRLYVRSEHLRLDTPDTAQREDDVTISEAQWVRSVFAGSHFEHTVRIGQSEVVAHSSTASRPLDETSDVVTLRVRRSDVLLYVDGQLTESVQP